MTAQSITLIRVNLYQYALINVV